MIDFAFFFMQPDAEPEEGDAADDDGDDAPAGMAGTGDGHGGEADKGHEVIGPGAVLSELGLGADDGPILDSTGGEDARGGFLPEVEVGPDAGAGEEDETEGEESALPLLDDEGDDEEDEAKGETVEGHGL